MTLFLCQWYKRDELATRIAFLFSKFVDLYKYKYGTDSVQLHPLSRVRLVG